MTYRILRGKVEQFARHYHGPKFHAILCDAPYHLTTITDRFGKESSAPAKGDVYARSAAGFMGEGWDGGSVAFKPETWAGLAENLYPGGFGMTFGGARTYHRIAVAIEDAGLIIHPMIFCYAFGSGFPKATRIDTQVDKLKRREYVQAAVDLGLDIPGNNLHDWTKAEHAPGDTWWNKFKAVLSDEQWQAIERQVIGQSEWSHQIGIPLPNQYNGQRQHLDITAPATELAQAWQGHRYGLQAMKPAIEPIILFQKPYEGRPVDDITATGAGALWVDGGRIAANDKAEFPAGIVSNTESVFGNGNGRYADRPRTADDSPAGRWPSNLILQHTPQCRKIGQRRIKAHWSQPTRGDKDGGLFPLSNKQQGKEIGYADSDGYETVDDWQCVDGCPAKRLGEQSGELTSGGYPANFKVKSDEVIYGDFAGGKTGKEGLFKSEGTAARFFFQADWAYDTYEQLANADPVYYTAKASATERNAGLEGRNPHPTIKPISLTKYLATLLLPPDAYSPRRILCPFAGTGSEMIGAILTGWDEVIGVEMTAKYIPVAKARLRWWSQWPGWGQTDVDKILQAQEGNLPLFSFSEAAQ